LEKAVAGSRLGAVLALGLGWLSAAGAAAQTEGGAAIDAGGAPAIAAPAAPALEVTVDARRERAEASARAVTRVELEEQRRTPSDLGQILARSEGVSVRRNGGLGSPARFALAGLIDEQIPIFIDGVPIEIAGFPFGLVNVPVGLLSSVEIHRGVVPVRLGADALGGAVDLITQLERPGPSSVVSYQAGSFDTHRATAALRYRHKPSGLLLRGTGFFDYARNDFPIRADLAEADGSFRSTRLRKRNDAYRAGAGTMEAGFLNRPWARALLLRYTRAALEKRIPHDLVMGTAYAKVHSGRVSDSLSLRYETPTKNDVSAAALLAYSGRQVTLDDRGQCYYDWVGRCVTETLPGGEITQRPFDQRVMQHSGFARLSVGYEPSAWAKLLLSTTLSGTRRTGRDLALEREADALLGRRDLLSVVSGLEHQLDAWDDRVQNIASVKHYAQFMRAEQLLFAGGFQGVRHDHNRFGLADGLRLTLRDGLLLKASYEWSTRLPSPDQVYGNGVQIQHNFALIPESSHNVNVGLAWTLLDTRLGSYSAKLFGFGRFSKDMIVFKPGVEFGNYDNISAVRTLGFEASTGWTSPHRYLALDANLTWQDLRNVSTSGAYAPNKGDPVPNRPPLFVNLSAVATASDWFGSGSELSLSYYGNYVQRFETVWDEGLKSTRPAVPSRFVHTLETTLLLRRALRSVSASLQVYNVNDARIFDVFGVQLPGRTVLAKLTLEV
jgi:vitamin B12 transporter